MLAAVRAERNCIDGVNVTLSWPTSKLDADGSSSSPMIKGVAFLLPGAMTSISEYDGLRDIILSRQHLVVSLFMNVLWPPCDNHRKHARDVERVFDGLKSTYGNLLSDIDAYAVVGHSVGAKVALLVASVVDPTRVKAVLALDPVDINPVEFSKMRGMNLPLNDDDDDGDELCSDDGDVVRVKNKSPRQEATANQIRGENDEKPQHHGSIPIVMTCTDGGPGISKAHDAEAIHALHPLTTCHRHLGAGHMAYCDHGGGWAGKLLMRGVGTEDGNSKARGAAHDLIRNVLG
mmetsp:Transcript_33921/g.82030  ORF Transcript_33921/g.82030 Transcript_33921/m.82030 type:complete len:290 (+) Transcript_33921:165-1034(+)